MAAPKGNQYAKGSKTSGAPLIYDDDFIENEAAALLEWIKGDNGLYIDSFARQRGYSRVRMWEWVQRNKVFANAMDEAKLWQEEKFLNKALNREWDSAQVRYTMARVCGDRWKNSWDKEEKDVKQSDLLEFLAALMAQAKAKDKPDANSGT